MPCSYTAYTHCVCFLKVEYEVELADLAMSIRLAYMTQQWLQVARRNAAHISEIPVEDFHVTMDDLECDELVVARRDGADEK